MRAPRGGGGVIAREPSHTRHSAKEEYTGPRDEAGRPHGAGGRLKQRNGDTYEGAFVHGEQSGHGMLATADGSKYVGTFRGGVPHGSGVFTYANGDVYTGQRVASVCCLPG